MPPNTAPSLPPLSGNQGAAQVAPSPHQLFLRNDLISPTKNSLKGIISEELQIVLTKGKPGKSAKKILARARSWSTNHRCATGSVVHLPSNRSSPRPGGHLGSRWLGFGWFCPPVQFDPPPTHPTPTWRSTSLHFNTLTS